MNNGSISGYVLIRLIGYRVISKLSGLLQSGISKVDLCIKLVDIKRPLRLDGDI